MSNITPLHPKQKPARPVIERDPGWCLMHLSKALKALEDLSLLEGPATGGAEQLNLLHRDDLASLFAVLGDYAEAVRHAIPEGTTQ